MSRLGDFLLGGAPAEAKRNARLAAHLAEQRVRTLSALFIALAGLTAGVAGGAWLVASDQSAFAQLGFAFGSFLAGGGLSYYLRARNARVAEREQVLTLGSIFLMEPEVLRGMLRESAIDEFVKNLLRTVLGDDDLGDSVWRQAVSPLVHAISELEYRERLHYDITIQAQDTPLAVGGADDAFIFSVADYELQITELSFHRRFKAAPDAIWLGVVFDPDEGPAWFNDSEHFFALREYTPLSREDVASIRRCCSGDPLAAARVLCAPVLEIDGASLECDRVRLDDRGLAVRFPLPRPVVTRLAGGAAARIRAGLTVPLSKAVSVFPAFVAEPTRGVTVAFDYGHAAVANCRTELFFSGDHRFRADHVRDRPGKRRVIATDDDEWVFAGNGMVFLWERPSGLAAAAEPTATPALTAVEENPGPGRRAIR